MGRLLRKKNPAKKKKRQNGEASLKANDAAKKLSQGSDQEIAEGNDVKTPLLIRKKSPGAGGSGSGIHKKNPSSAILAKIGIGGVVDKTFQFLREVKAELRKVTWPQRKQTMGSTVVVIILVMVISFFLGLVDIGLSGLIRLVLK